MAYQEIQRLYRGNQIKKRPVGWALMQYDWCFYKERKFDNRENIQRGKRHSAKTDIDSQGERPGTGLSSRPSEASPLILDLWPLELREENFLLVKPL